MNDQIATQNLFMDIMIVHLYMFCARMKNRIAERAIVEILSHHNTGMWGRKMRNSLNKLRSQDKSPVVVAKAQYSSLVEEQEIVGCFFKGQEIGQGPRKTRRPVVE